MCHRLEFSRCQVYTVYCADGHALRKRPPVDVLLPWKRGSERRADLPRSRRGLEVAVNGQFEERDLHAGSLELAHLTLERPDVRSSSDDGIS